jgi:AcrR family transcriptional regulator
MRNNDKGTKDHLSVQENIREAAEAVFCKKGYAGTRISEIAEMAKVNQALVHYYYENKEKLYQAVLAPLIEQWKQHVQQTQWIGVNPRQIIRQFIYTHCEYHFRYPSLYRLSLWEELEGKNLFATPFFNQDLLEKITVLSIWKQNGQIQPGINVNTLLYLIWGMIQKFFDKSSAELAALLKSEVTAEQLQLEVAEQITELVLNGVFGLGKEEAAIGRPAAASASMQVAVWLPAALSPEHEQAKLKIWDQLSRYPDVQLTRLAEVRQLLEASSRYRGLVVVVDSHYGEMPGWLAELIGKWTADPASIAGRCAAVWVLGSAPSSLALQQIIEDHINRLGGYTFSRFNGQTEQDYIKRFHILVHSVC